MQIRIRWPGGEIMGRLDDNPTTQAVAGVLPVTASANTWGDEVYFDVGVDVALDDDAQQVVDPGTICYWVQGSSIALPFGPTPISEGGECRLAAKVNLIGKLDGDPGLLRSVRDGDQITVEAV